MYYDVNNLYGDICNHAEFQWIKNAIFDISVIAPDLLIGYILKVDLEYPHICIIDTLTCLSARRTINRPANARMNF